MFSVFVLQIELMCYASFTFTKYDTFVDIDRATTTKPPKQVACLPYQACNKRTDRVLALTCVLAVGECAGMVE